MRKGPFGPRVRVPSLSCRRPSLFLLQTTPRAGRARALRYRQVGSLLRNGFSDFFATIKGPGRRQGWGMAIARRFEGEFQSLRRAGHVRVRYRSSALARIRRTGCVS